MPSLAQALIGDKPNATIAISDWALHATRAATKTIPIVAAPMSADPVIAGVAESWAHQVRIPERSGCLSIHQVRHLVPSRGANGGSL